MPSHGRSRSLNMPDGGSSPPSSSGAAILADGRSWPKENASTDTSSGAAQLQKASLDSDILKEAEQIRRERNSKRAREAQRERAEAEAKLTGQQQAHAHPPQPVHRRTGSREPTTDDESGAPDISVADAAPGSAPGLVLVDAGVAAAAPKEKIEEDKVLVGNLIGEDHVNYVLMYNMLTGIRIGVSSPSF